MTLRAGMRSGSLPVRIDDSLVAQRWARSPIRRLLIRPSSTALRCWGAAHRIAGRATGPLRPRGGSEWSRRPPAILRTRDSGAGRGRQRHGGRGCGGASVLQQQAAADGIELTLWRDEVVRAQHVAVRIGADGPIVQSLPTEGFWVRENVEGYHMLHDLGEAVYQSTSRLICSDLPDDVRLHVEIFKAGVTFADGSIEKWLSQQDFDAFGRCDLILLKPAALLGSVCHQISAYEGRILSIVANTVAHHGSSQNTEKQCGRLPPAARRTGA